MAVFSTVLSAFFAIHLLAKGAEGAVGLKEPKEVNEPVFATKGRTVEAITSDTVVLPCEIINLGNYVLAWKRGIAVLSAGSTKVSPDERYRLVDGYNLEIRDVTPMDAGEYICQIGTIIPKEVQHTLQILVPPEITKVTKDGQVVVKKGQSATLSCEAAGNPVPKIAWIKKNDQIPQGTKSEGSTIVLEHVTRHQAGIYVCTATNGVGKPVSREISLQVDFPPEIQVEKSWIHSGEGNEANLVCIVHAVPHAEVVWFRGSLRLDTTERRSTEVRGSRHTLIIRKVQASDFGNYSCLADNGIGKTRQNLELSGKPQQAMFRSHHQGRSKDTYNITWVVQSYTPIEEYRLYWRRVPPPTQLPGHQSPNYQHSRRSQRREENDVTLGGLQLVSGYHRDMGWNEAVLPAVPSEQYTQGSSYLIRGLEPSTQYEAKVHAKNRFGWNLASERFQFTTRSQDPEMRDLGVTAYGVSTRYGPWLLLVGCSLLVAGLAPLVT